MERTWWKEPLAKGDLLVLEDKRHVIVDSSCQGELTVSALDGTDQRVISEGPCRVLMRLPSNVGGAFSLRDLLRGLWGNLSFGRVSRVVCRACDLNIWWNTSDPQDRKYLGDNQAILQNYSRADIVNHITFEYDYYYGFAGSLFDKDHWTIPTNKATRVADRIVTEDLDELGVAGLEEALQNDRYSKPDSRLSAECREHECELTLGFSDEETEPKSGALPRETTTSDPVEEVPEVSVQPGESSFHFASNNFAMPWIFTNRFGPQVAEKDPFGCDTYSVVPPKIDTLICGVPCQTSRGLSITKWWVCSESFFNLWKIVCSDSAAQGLSYQEMQSLKWRQATDGTSFSRFYQELAQTLKGVPKGDALPFKPCAREPRTEAFIAALQKLAQSPL